MPGPAQKALPFLAQGFEDLEAAAVTAVCGWTGYREHLPSIHLTTTGLHAEVQGRFGTRIRPHRHLEDVDPDEYAALAVPGGFFSHGFDEAFDPRLYRLARQIHARAGMIATWCVGVLPIAEAGLLRGGRATTYRFSRHHDNPGRLQVLGCEPVPAPPVVWNRIASCAGPAQSLDVAFLLLEFLVGETRAAGVRRYLAGVDGEGMG